MKTGTRDSTAMIGDEPKSVRKASLVNFDNLTKQFCEIAEKELFQNVSN